MAHQIPVDCERKQSVAGQLALGSIANLGERLFIGQGL